MKKITMTLAGLLLVGLAAVNAQTDSTLRNRPTEEPMEQPSPSPSQSQYRSADRVTVPADQVPSSLRQTLQGSQYKGWETTPLYQDRRTQEYYFELPDANGTTKRMYRFDRNGKAISGSNMTPASPGNDGSMVKPQGQEEPQKP